MGLSCVKEVLGTQDQSKWIQERYQMERTYVNCRVGAMSKKLINQELENTVNQMDNTIAQGNIQVRLDRREVLRLTDKMVKIRKYKDIVQKKVWQLQKHKSLQVKSLKKEQAAVDNLKVMKSILRKICVPGYAGADDREQSAEKCTLRGRFEEMAKLSRSFHDKIDEHIVLYEINKHSKKKRRHILIGEGQNKPQQDKTVGIKEMGNTEGPNISGLHTTAIIHNETAPVNITTLSTLHYTTLHSPDILRKYDHSYHATALNINTSGMRAVGDQTQISNMVEHHEDAADKQNTSEDQQTRSVSGVVLNLAIQSHSTATQSASVHHSGVNDATATSGDIKSVAATGGYTASVNVTADDVTSAAVGPHVIYGTYRLTPYRSELFVVNKGRMTLPSVRTASVPTIRPPYGIYRPNTTTAVRLSPSNITIKSGLLQGNPETAAWQTNPARRKRWFDRFVNMFSKNRKSKI